MLKDVLRASYTGTYISSSNIGYCKIVSTFSLFFFNILRRNGRSFPFVTNFD